MRIAAGIAAALVALVALFQLALALGAPLGRAAWGGAHAGVLPTGLRIASGAVGVALYPLLIVVVLASAGMLGGVSLESAAPTVMWTLTAFFGLGALLNAVSRSRVERLWAPVVAIIAVCCGLVASQA